MPCHARAAGANIRAAYAPEVILTVMVGPRGALSAAALFATLGLGSGAWAQSASDAGAMANPDATATSAAAVGTDAGAAATAEAGAATEQPASGGSGASGGNDAVAQARQHFDQGAALFEANNFEAALVEFERAYELLAGDPNQYTVLYNIGQCQERLFRYDEAMRAYQRYLREGGEQEPDRVRVEATVHALEGLLGVVSLRINIPSAEVWVDDRRVGTAPGEIHVAGGRHTVEVRAPGYLPARQEVSVPARERREVALELQTVRDTFGVSPVFFGGALGLAVVCAGVGAVFGAQALSAYNDVTARQSDPVQRYTVQGSEGEAIRRNANIADAFFGGAALFAVTAGTLFFFTDFKGQRTSSDAPGNAPRTSSASRSRGGATVRLAPFGPAGVQILGVF